MFVESLMRSVTPSSPSSREALDVEVLAVGRRVVELEVAAVDDGAGVGADGERRRVGDGVRDADGLDAERARRRTACAGAVSKRRACARTSCSPSRSRMSPSAYGGAQTGTSCRLQQVGEGADVVLVTVGDDDAARCACRTSRGR